MKQKSDLYKLTLEIPVEYFQKLNSICEYRHSNNIPGRFKREVVMDAIDILYHCHKNNGISVEIRS